MFYVYVIRSNENGKLYKGYSSNLRRRIAEHNRGKVYSTKSGGSWKLIYYEAFLNKTDALREEKFLKSGSGRKVLLERLKETLR